MVKIIIFNPIYIRTTESFQMSKEMFFTQNRGCRKTFSTQNNNKNNNNIEDVCNFTRNTGNVDVNYFDQCNFPLLNCLNSFESHEYL